MATPTRDYPTNIEMHDYIQQSVQRRLDMLDRVGCCGCRDICGVCRLTLHKCRVVANAERVLRLFARFSWEDRYGN